MRILPFILAAFAFFIALPAFSAPVKSITVAGFVNSGARADDSVNTMISRSLISFLSRVPGVRVVPFDDIAQAQEKTEYWKKNKPDPETAIGLGLELDTRQVITGDYSVDEARNIITINVLVYNTVSGELVLKRQYSGGAGMELFDTVDKAIANITYLVLGRAVKLARLKVAVSSDKTYTLYINGSRQKDITSAQGYEDSILAGETVEVSLRLSNGSTEVARYFVNAAENTLYPIEYKPSGTILVKTGGGLSGTVLLDGKEAGKLDQGGEFNLYNVSAGALHTVSIVAGGRAVYSRAFNLREGETRLALYGKAERELLFPVSISWFGASMLGIQAGLEYELPFGTRAGLYAGLLYYSIFAGFTGLSVSHPLLTLGEITLRAQAGIQAFFTDPLVWAAGAGLELSLGAAFVYTGVRYAWNVSSPAPRFTAGLGWRF